MNQTKRNNKSTKLMRASSIIKLALLALILIGVPLYIFFFQHDLIEYFSSLKNIRMWLAEYKAQSIFIYIGAQVFQIIICIIPGQALQFAAGYMYGFWLGYIFSLVGAAIGSAVVYYLARILGHDALHFLFGQGKITEMIDHMNSRKGIIITFIIFLVPGIPKDLCSYAAGLSNVKLKPYLIVSLIGRTPGMMGSLIIGRQIGAGGYVSAAVIAAVAIVLCILGVIFRKKILDATYKICDKLLDM